MKKPLNEVAKVQSILKFAFGLVFIIAGADKFANMVTYWGQYISPSQLTFLPINVHVFLKIVGVIEFAIGILVFIKTKTGAYLVSAWLIFIALSLVITQKYFDIALFDLLMATCAYSLARLTQITTVNV